MKNRNNRRFVVGVMGGGDVSGDISQLAYELGCSIAGNGWILLNGGRDSGVMRASAEGAKSKGGMTVGILPGHSGNEANPFIDIAIVTGMGAARNVINVLSSDVVIALPGEAGTLSEIALALKHGRSVILLKNPVRELIEQACLGGAIYSCETVIECIDFIKKFTD